MSTFMGLETARRAMSTAQFALHTTGHNIANANTPGYTRQRVNFVQTEPFPAAAMNRPQIPGQVGTGVAAGSVQRVREQFLDVQFRNELSKFGYWTARHEGLVKMEDIMNEPSEQGLANTIDRFWQSLQDLAAQPEDAGARAVVRQRGEAVADTFRYAHDSLSALRRDIGDEIDTVEKEVNSLLQQINSLNKQIGETEPHGYVTNDLYDERDRIVDRLAELVNIKTERVVSGGKPSPIAEGRLTIHFVDSTGNTFGPPLVDGSNPDNLLGIKVSFSENNLVQNIGFGQIGDDSRVAEVTGLFGDTTEAFNANGKLKGLIEVFGYTTGEVDALGNPAGKGLYPKMLSDLDEMAFVFATQFNEIHESGWSLNEINNGKPEGTGVSFFRDLGNAGHNATGILSFSEADKIGFASRIAVSNDVRNSLDNLAASGAAGANGVRGEAFAGDGSNALKLANMKDVRFTFNGSNGSVQSFYRSVIGDMAVDTSEAARRKNNSDVLLHNIQRNKDAVSSVSLDEELTNMIQFQHAYNAAARNITMIDEMLDRIINGMGVVGR
ncbi:flagellar hook-associated protein FlgK [Bacillus alkalicellulosilyticus]|uniref:flagellar hook-associated protein FlgK n=1 Tax=Alkalihalobacterium alkalicellulosilyticum TaxID=1912214 RepID=UPI0009977EEC|nr:flagellar hook-associated protein FlgK [Bacillus alkalicellulosilyticus]